MPSFLRRRLIPERVRQGENGFLLGCSVRVAPGVWRVFFEFDGRSDSCALAAISWSGSVSVVVASLREVAIVLFKGDCSQHIPSQGTAHANREQLCLATDPGRCGLI